MNSSFRSFLKNELLYVLLLCFSKNGDGNYKALLLRIRLRCGAFLFIYLGCNLTTCYQQYSVYAIYCNSLNLGGSLLLLQNFVHSVVAMVRRNKGSVIGFRLSHPPYRILLISLVLYRSSFYLFECERWTCRTE